jgi:hypothetical protein|tara:strand:- start:4503 stop:4904 length:402 start_codon:yes stop_codon:yes gene_type:complete
MLDLDKTLWQSDLILKIVSTCNWSDKDTDILLNCALNTIKELISECISNDTKCVLLFDSNKGEVPSFYYLTKIFSFLLGIKSIINEGVEFSIVYGSKESIGNVLPMILKIYKPTRPLHIVNSKDELKKILKNK